MRDEIGMRSRRAPRRCTEYRSDEHIGHPNLIPISSRSQTAKYGEGSGRRDFLVVLILQLGAATFRGVSGRQCTAEEIKERNEKVLDAKGITTPR